MDCERFEATMIDELYDELDELTSAAAKRHVAGCSRCSSLIGGLRATRRVAVLPMVEPSVDLEDRILAAARNAQKVVPIGRRLSHAVSLAGSWAMRPQTAMAAVFVLAVGGSLLFVRRRKVSEAGSVTVTAQGQPGEAFATTPADTPQAPLDSKAAAAAHGAPSYGAPPAAAASAAPAATEALALKERERDDRAYLPKGSVSSGFGDDSRLGEKNASATAGAPSPRRSALPGRDELNGPTDNESVAQNSSPSKSQWAGGSGGGSAAAPPAPPASPAPVAQAPADANASLQATNATRDRNGCGAAVDGYDQIAQQNAGTKVGNDAKFAAAQCYGALGKTAQALQRYQGLLTEPQYVEAAKRGIQGLSAQAQLAPAHPAPKKAASKPAAPATAPTSSAQQAPAQSIPPAL